MGKRKAGEGEDDEIVVQDERGYRPRFDSSGEFLPLKNHRFTDGPYFSPIILSSQTDETVFQCLCL
jgi:hypothetical protein